MIENTTTRVQKCLARLKAGEVAAFNDLIETAQHRLLHLTRKMVGEDGRRLVRFEPPDDIFQDAMLRLTRALQDPDCRPQTPRDFFKLAAAQVRRQLVDLARRYLGPKGRVTRPIQADPSGSSRQAPEQEDSSFTPKKLDAWTALHEAVELLPDDEREVFDLLWYQGLTHEEAAETMETYLVTVRHTWRRACVRLHDLLDGNVPPI